MLRRLRRLHPHPHKLLWLNTTVAVPRRFYCGHYEQGLVLQSAPSYLGC